MRSRLFVWLILFTLGVLVGDRYGLPGWASGIGARGFSPIESWFGRLGDPIPQNEEGDEAEQNQSDSPQPSAQQPSQPTGSDSDIGNAQNANLRINDAGLKIIKDSEGLRLEAYNLGGQWLIGYGHSRTARAGMTITEAEAERLLREDIRASEDAVRKMVTVPVNQNQFSAMVSLAYNMGAGGFSRSSVLSEINAGDYQGAANAFRNHNRAGGRENEHLTERREKERTLFLTPA
ncbi:MAG: lysozyme [Pseudomonadota bacterium]